MTVGGCKETKSMVIKLTILYFFLFDGYKVEWQWKLLLQNRSSRPSTLPDSGVTSTLTLGSPLQQWLKFAEPVLQIRQEAFLISSAGSRPWDKVRPRTLDKEGPLDKEEGTVTKESLV